MTEVPFKIKWDTVRSSKSRIKINFIQNYSSTLSGLSIIAMIASDEEFLIWTNSTGKKLKVSIPYTDVNTTPDREPRYLMDNAVIQVSSISTLYLAKIE